MRRKRNNCCKFYMKSISILLTDCDSQNDFCTSHSELCQCLQECPVPVVIVVSRNCATVSGCWQDTNRMPDHRPIQLVIAIHLILFFHSPLHLSRAASTVEGHGVEDATSCPSSAAKAADSCSFQNYDDADMGDENSAVQGSALDELVSDRDSCIDDNPRCGFWATLEPSECETNPIYMAAHCKKSCRVCGRTSPS